MPFSAVAIVDGWVAALGHSGGHESVGRVFIEQTVVVFEAVAPTVVRVVEGTHQEHRHLTTGHQVVRAVSAVRRRVAAPGYPLRSDRLDCTFEDVPVVIDERPARRKRRQGSRSRQKHSKSKKDSEKPRPSHHALAMIDMRFGVSSRCYWCHGRGWSTVGWFVRCCPRRRVW